MAGCLAWSERLRLATFRGFVRTLKSDSNGLWAYLETKLTNGLMKALNCLLQLAKRIARGSYPLEGLKNRVY
jgi:transposase